MGASVVALASAVVWPCTTVSLQNGETRIVANSYDYYAVDGRVIVNRRGLHKVAFETNSGLQWVSRYGSITFEQWGHELPTSGMNEAGLVVEQMMLEGTQFPANSDPRPSLLELQWMQYQLDCSASVEEVLASDRRIRISRESSPLHFLIADAAGNVVVIDFLNGQMVAHTGATLPIPALTNNTYDSSLAYAAITAPEAASHTSSLGRFVHAADAAATFARTNVDDPIAYAFATLDRVNQPNWTRWNTVCDIGRRRVYFRTQASPAIKAIAFSDVDFRPSATTRMMDINSPSAGVMIPDQLYSRADNLALLVSVFRQTTPYANVPFSYLQQRASYPDLVQVEPYAPVFLAHPSSATVGPGGTAVFSVDVAAEPEPSSYSWRKDGVSLPGATGPALNLPAVNATDAGDYAVDVSNALGTTTSRSARLIVAAPQPGRLVNMSARGTSGVDGQPLIVGFVVRGGAKRLLVRAIGPSLGTLFDVEGTLANPRLDAHQRVDAQDQVLASNDDWAATPAGRDLLREAFVSVGAFPLPVDSLDAALLVDVSGACTFHAPGAPGSGAGVALIEGYDTRTGDLSRLVNISTRNYVGTGADVLVVGFVIDGNTPRRLLLRGVGPSLGPLFGLGGALANPMLELHLMVNERDVVVARNDDWADEPGAAAAATSAGAFALPGGSKDAVLVVTVPAGSYTVILSGVAGGTGTGLIEVYELPSE